MHTFWPIVKKDLTQFWGSVNGLVFTILFVVVGAWLFFQNFFLAGVADLGQWWNTAGFLLLLFAPAIGMGTLNNEQESGTWELALSLPLSDKVLILGLYCARLVFLVSGIILSLGIPLSVAILGNPDVGMLLGGYLGLVLLAGAYLATTVFFSSIFGSAATFLYSFVFLLGNSMLGQDIVVLRLPVVLRPLVTRFVLNQYQQEMAAGLITLEGCVFFASWIGLFLTFTWFVVRLRND